ncbi:hypothetical protein B0T19DRAFT_438369 [Cercophora scortea]|uniref:Uncharacterized protein n=1 Tax=Cercophora scortea TaxID=314031 RepID=A0AAE0MM66_9PEZI|nr:hypothetical protein B0T19DRAFT_438369 [Cercophora scortea]
MYSPNFIIALLAIAGTAIAAPAPEASAPGVFHPIETNGGLTKITGPDGLYISHNSTHMSYHGLSEDAATGKRSDDAVLARADGNCDVVCIAGQFTSSSAISSAQAGLRSAFASNPNWKGNIFYLANSVYAFGCDYGSGQNTPASQYDVDVSCMQSACGGSQAAYNRRRTWKATYGREIGGFSC